MDTFEIKAYAKINLGLDVLGRLPDGYHQVKMIMQSIGICDTLTLERIPAGILLTTDAPGLSTGSDNLIHKAVLAMQKTYRVQKGVRIHLHKEIPIAAGTAGGSADAAAAMKGVNELFGIHAPLSELMKLGVSIGADVPYCLLGGTALAEGIGEVLTPLPPLPDCHILVAKPDISVSTRYVYEHLDRADCLPHPDIDQMKAAILDGSLEGVLEHMGNVLETVTIPAWPVIDAIKQDMRRLGAANGLMSGSGPTVFGIFKEEDTARSALESLQQSGLASQVFLTGPV